MFIDYAKIYVKGGQGGSGACSFRREKHVPKGGPDGGDGGKGGSIILQVDPHLRTLIDFKYKKHYVARHGQHGMGKRKYGKDANDIVVKVPAGTVVKDAGSGEILTDLINPDDYFVAAKGGKRGRGNAHFATSTHQAPREWEVGDPGEERQLILELKIIADVGLVGKPNAGKSTLLSKVSAARPKIAEYPFTTLQPNLGIVKLEQFQSFVVADIPGLIEGAHRGKGLGHQFLRHIERTQMLLYLIDPTTDDPEQTYKALLHELEEYSTQLVKKKSIVVLNKKDVWSKDFSKLIQENLDLPLFSISAVTGEGIDVLIHHLWHMLQDIPEETVRSKEQIGYE